VVQSTLPPQLYKWKKHPDILPRLLGDPKIVALADRFGYDKGNIAEWL